MYLIGLYKVTGKILVAPIEGKGTFTANISKTQQNFHVPPIKLKTILAADIDLDMYQKAKIVVKRGEEYIQPVNTTTNVEIGDAVTDIKGLFDGNTELGLFNLPKKKLKSKQAITINFF